MSVTNRHAIQELVSIFHPDCGFGFTGDFEEMTDLSGLTIGENEKIKFTFDDVKQKKTELQAEYDAQEYARKRQEEYPSIQELVVALYDTDDKADIEAKRAEGKKKYPKPE